MPEPMKNNKVIVCRCEEVSFDDVGEAIAAGASSLNDLKRRTRGGMGLCQGAYCLHEMAALLATSLDVPLASISPMTMRPPVGGVTLSALAESAPDAEAESAADIQS